MKMSEAISLEFHSKYDVRTDVSGKILLIFCGTVDTDISNNGYCLNMFKYMT